MKLRTGRFAHLSVYVAALSIAILLGASPGFSGAAGGPFLDRFTSVDTVASTVPFNGDVNPYGIALILHDAGRLRQGSYLVSNFNNAANLQGTGTSIVQISPGGETSLFAQIDARRLGGHCPGGVGLTTALSILHGGWVIVGSLPSPSGAASSAMAGCLIVLNSRGEVVETFAGDGINGPWDMTAFEDRRGAWLFVTNVLNGNVTSGTPHRVDEGTVLRIRVELPTTAGGIPRRISTTVIGSGFGETADPNALVIGPTGVGLSFDGRPGGTLYVADALSNRIVAIDGALTRGVSAGQGRIVSSAGSLAGPLGLVIAPNGDILVVNSANGNIVEVTPLGQQVAVKTIDTVTGAGSLFGLAVSPNDNGIYFVDDGDNTLKLFTGPPAP
ncbi:MAG: hypothetical protein ABSF50_14850 [Burkholderiaceae bacterium]|jgi:DNA-binding beta-propeller fold protein YncE